MLRASWSPLATNSTQVVRKRGTAAPSARAARSNHMYAATRSWATPWPCKVGKPERELSLLVPLVGRATEPRDGLGVVVRGADPQPVHEPEVELTSRMPLLGSQAVPLARLQVVLANAVSVVVHAAELELGRRRHPISRRVAHPFPALRYDDRHLSIAALAARLKFPVLGRSGKSTLSPFGA